MIRRTVSLFLIPLFVLQGMAFSHSHGGSGVQEPPGHDYAPHFHFGFFLGSHGLHPQHGHDSVPDNPEGEAADQQVPGQDHDSDAVYVIDLAIAGRTAPPSDPASWQSLLTPICTVMVGMIATPSAGPPAQSMPPPFPGRFGCPLFLQTLELLL